VKSNVLNLIVATPCKGFI